MRQNNSGGSASSKSELEKYLAEDSGDPDKTFDILGWWKENSSRFPILGNMARDILAIPITTVASESAFSTSGRILDNFRTSLTPFMVHALVCTQDWLRRSTDPVDIKENLEELEELEKELIEEFGDKVKKKPKVNGGVVASSMAKSKACPSRPTK